MDTSTVTGNYYLISHLTLITGLTDRTIRNYISAGFLQGEKINGLWHFTPEQVDAFLRNPAVRPSILAKNNSIVYDFLLEDKKTEEEMCLILDMPGHEAKEAAEFFCWRISTGDYRNIRFAFDAVGNAPRIILKGGAKAVMELVNQYRNR